MRSIDHQSNFTTTEKVCRKHGPWDKECSELVKVEEEQDLSSADEEIDENSPPENQLKGPAESSIEQADW